MKSVKLTIMAMAMAMFWGLLTLVPGAMAAEVSVAKLHAVMSDAPAQGFWQIRADELHEWIKQERTDFVVVDVRPNPAEFAAGHIPGAIQIPVQGILSPESLAKLPKDKKLILICVTGQTQNLPVVPLRALGYDAYTMSFGYSAWIHDYHGAHTMQQAIENAAPGKFPLFK
ncbi:rhodanese-like domain-containing protein [Desulfurivibrio alkaliphilus]|uniref:Rhodanese domain protein n=1 Tax=Desulfurivibrio alkaliphilus (strain DSM 19089 / UNIQEM U267 / AHT2) TaxID=589865 RepID=D6Z5X7_DESAT|nr:rhodanese-like domain-containing protein [Desulfurivibrio alkaliphilus]ADH84859.1 Rhodanese domain protein [Desulfurivibrio alkaliphilus AHT 2]